MGPQTLSVFHPDSLGLWLAMVGFGAYHGLNPGMGWLFALALGLQQRSERVIWVSLLPIAIGHAASIALVAVILMVVGKLISLSMLHLLTASILLAFGVYKLFTYYRHPRWVGMRVSLRDLFVWSFLMAVAHGAGLMVAPTMVGLASVSGSPGPHFGNVAGLSLAVCLHTLSMLVVMASIAWVVYKKLGLAILRKSWVNFDLIWAVALLVVGGIALIHSI
jgi:hypothetical protein